MFVTMLWLLRKAELSAIYFPRKKNTEIVLHNRDRLYYQIQTREYSRLLLHRHRAIFQYIWIYIFIYVLRLMKIHFILPQDWKVCKWRCCRLKYNVSIIFCRKIILKVYTHIYIWCYGFSVLNPVYSREKKNSLVMRIMQSCDIYKSLEWSSISDFRWEWCLVI